MNLFAWYQKVISIRKENETFVYGKFREVLADDKNEVLAYERYDKENSFITVINNSFYNNESVELDTGYSRGEFKDLLTGRVFDSNREGKLVIDLQAKSGAILKKL